MRQAEFEHQQENGQWVDCFDKVGRCKRPQRPKRKSGKKRLRKGLNKRFKKN